MANELWVERNCREMTESSSARKAWIDVAKGLCMVLVVLRHATLWIENEFNDGTTLVWWEVSEFFSPVRMPLFFLISGYLVTNAVRRPLARSRARTIGFLYLYAVWSGLFLLRLWIPVPGINDSAPLWRNFFIALALPTVFWYIWALALYFVASWLLLKLFGPLAPWFVVPLFALAFTAPALNEFFIPLIPGPIDALKFGSIVSNFVWFYAGVHGREVWDRISSRATSRSFAVWLAAYVGAFAIATVEGLGTPLLPALALVAVIASAHAVPVVRGPRFVTRCLEEIGRLTFPVYIFHIFGISVISLLAKASGVGLWVSGNVALAGFFIPPVLTVLLVWASMAVGRVILNSPARWLMSPDWLKQRPVKVGV